MDEAQNGELEVAASEREQRGTEAEQCWWFVSAREGERCAGAVWKRLSRVLSHVDHVLRWPIQPSLTSSLSVGGQQCLAFDIRMSSVWGTAYQVAASW
ncbi:hypothetical protein FH972_022652 [Carpinus fangiana]|uniref:Uncharacterized protein n=1 Tax=Carpinus fangiana TaxID=176857 RepID=A0A5N6KSU7_9ROSI|nr:hypothetical protein FH972_022652 [Carpinus fangiana]